MRSIVFIALVLVGALIGILSRSCKQNEPTAQVKPTKETRHQKTAHLTCGHLGTFDAWEAAERKHHVKSGEVSAGVWDLLNKEGQHFATVPMQQCAVTWKWVSYEVKP